VPRVIFTLGVGLAPQRRLERAHAGGVLLHGDSQVEKVVVRRCRAGVPARRRCRRGQHGGRERDDGVEKRRREIDHPCRDWNEGVIGSVIVRNTTSTSTPAKSSSPLFGVFCLLGSASLWALYEVLIPILLPGACTADLNRFIAWRGVWNFVLLWPQEGD